MGGRYARLSAVKCLSVPRGRRLPTEPQLSTKARVGGEGIEDRIWRKANIRGRDWSKPELRDIARKEAGHARAIGNLVQNGYSEDSNGRYHRTEKGDRHVERAMKAGQQVNWAPARRSRGD